MSQTLLGRAGQPDDVARVVVVPRVRPRRVGHRRRRPRRRRRAGGMTADGLSTDRTPEGRRCATSSPAPRRPTGFPAFHDIPAGRYTSDEF